MQMPDFSLTVPRRSSERAAQWSPTRSRPGSSYSRRGITEEEWNDEDEDDEEWEGEGGEEFEFGEEEGDMAAGLVEGEDPILSAHTQLSVYRRERVVQPEVGHECSDSTHSENPDGVPGLGPTTKEAIPASK